MFLFLPAPVPAWRTHYSTQINNVSPGSCSSNLPTTTSSHSHHQPYCPFNGDTQSELQQELKCYKGKEWEAAEVEVKEPLLKLHIGNNKYIIQVRCGIMEVRCLTSEYKIPSSTSLATVHTRRAILTNPLLSFLALIYPLL